jgi:16S rRNA (guanine(966)-N(2))-methyltransferase RsmD
VRVIAGTLKGRRLKAPTWNGLRPTSDKLRGTLFNVLAPLIEGARVLDAYAGTGALGIEALSRGAAEVIFVERDRRAQALIAENLARCGAASGCAIIRASLAHAVEELRRGARSFDVVLLDPPYDVAPEAAIVPASALLAPEGVLVLEHAARQRSPDLAGGLGRTRRIVSGDSALSFYSCLR